MFGYRWDGNQLVIVPEETAIVKRIYQNFLDGKSRLETEREFAAKGITTRDGYHWVDSNIKVVLSNNTYTGNMLLQKEYIADPISNKRKKNHGELPQYYVEGNHETIIPPEKFDMVQQNIYENAHVILDQKASQKKYDDPTSRNETLKICIEDLNEQISQTQAQKAAVGDFLPAFEKIPEQTTDKLEQQT